MQKSRYRVLVTDRAWPDCDVERKVLARVGGEVVEAPDQQESTFIRLAADVDAIATCWAQVTPAVVRAASNSRVIARFGIGLDNIAVETATELQIPVTYVPDYCVPEVSDHALALLMTCARKVAFFHQRTKQGEYNLQAGPHLRRLSDQVLGLVGLGRIARAVASKARGLGLRVVAHTPSSQDYETSCQMVTLSELLETADFVSLHLPLSDASRHLIGPEELSRMKPSAYLINTSRGALIDHDALWHALQANQIAGAALDVFDPEPPDLSRPLYGDQRVIITPHAAFLSDESLFELRSRTAQQVADALQGRRPENVVNPEVYENTKTA